MGDFLRRLLWLVPLLALGAAGLFALLGLSRPVRARQELPLFYNAAPRTAESAALAALEGARRGDSRARLELAQLGGAGLVTILPRLPLLPPDERRRVADALWPVAERMGFDDDAGWPHALGREPSASSGSDRRLLFWQRYREDHALDLKPLVVQRLVRRLSRRGLRLRESDLLVLDTYALPTLVEQLGRIDSARDVERVERLVPLIAHMTGEDWEIPAGASPREARSVVTSIRRYWDIQGSRWTALEPLSELAARVSQTEFGVWLARTVREVVRLDSPTVLASVAELGKTSLVLVLLSVLGALLLGPSVAGLMHLLRLDRRLDGAGRHGPRLALNAALVVLVPGAVLRAPSEPAAQGALALAVGAVSVAYLLHRELADRLDWRSHAVLRRRPALARVSAIARWLAPTLPTLAPLVVAELAVWVTCIEASSGALGLGTRTLRAFAEGDLPWLMAVCLSVGLLAGLVQVLADLATGSPRLERRES